MLITYTKIYISAKEAKTMKSKKSFAGMFEVMVGLIVVVLLVVVITYIYPRLIGKGTAQASDFLSLTKDYDNDGVADYFDKCACIQGSDKYDGCNSEAKMTGQAAIEREKVCRETIKKAHEKK